jgi:hypothetical protein
MEREIQHVKHYSRNKATHEPEKLVTILMALTHATRTASHDVAALDLAAASEAGSDSSEQSEGEAGGGLQEAGARDQRGRRGGRQPLDDGRGNDGCRMIGKGALLPAAGVQHGHASVHEQRARTSSGPSIGRA